MIRSKKSKDEAARTRRFALGTIVFLVLALITTQIFLHQTSVGSPRFVRGTFLLWSATVLVVLCILVLATVLGRNLIRLYFDRRSGLVGSRFRTRMVSMTVVLSLLPALLLFFLAYGLINVSIETWFRAPAGQLLENSRAIADQYYQEAGERARHFAGAAALEFGGYPRSRVDARLAGLRLRFQLDNIRLFDEQGGLAGEAGTRVSIAAQKESVRELVTAALKGEAGFRVERISPSDALREVVWGASAVRDRDGRVVGAVLTEVLIPQSVQFKSHSVLEAYDAYQELQRNKGVLRFNILLILVLTTLLVVFAFSWFAMYLAKRITVPIQALAEGAAAVAAGNLDHRVQSGAIDELGDLVRSFNQMTADLQENKSRIEATQASLGATNVELDNRRRYIETILQTIATGVISLDSELRVRTMNRAAAQMLEVQGAAGESRLEDIVQGPAAETLRALMNKSAILGPVVKTIELALPGRRLHLATTVTPLLDSAGERTGWVIALDDVTELLRVEKMAAWQEVARRLAHEIKNPLTPIQLSAERILARYRNLVEPAGGGRISPRPTAPGQAAFGAVLEESVRTISDEAASLKNLVDEFSRFARMPEVRLEESDLHGIIDNALSLYNGRIQEVEIARDYDPAVPRLQLDPEQLKRVFVNLFDNALEAMAENPNPKVLGVRTVCRTALQSVRIEVSDTGRGFPSEYQDSLFLPYFSTRRDGTGLGLAIVRQIISDHKGYVRAEQNPPAGTRIVIDLPLALS